MTLKNDLALMAEVVNAKYEQQQRRFAKLVAKENKLRAELTRIDEMSRAIKAPGNSVSQMQAIGADVIWQGWVSRSKTALNIQLAQVLAQKEHHQTAVSKAYGKVLVVGQMQEEVRTDAKSKRSQSQLNTAIAQALLG